MRTKKNRITRRHVGTVSIGILSIAVAFAIGINTSRNVTSDTSMAADVGGSAVVLRGDVNSDGTVDINDAVLLQEFAMHIADPTPAQRKAGDLDGSGDIDALDVLKLLKSLSRK